jgi:hypothetical protein
VKGGRERNFTTKEMISIFPLQTFHLYVATFELHLPMEYMYIYLSWYDIPKLVVHIRISLIEGCCQQGSYWTKGSSSLSWSHHFESFTVATMTWLTVMEYLCHKWPRICSTCRKHFRFLSPFTTYHRVCKEINTTDATSGTGTAYPSVAPEFTLGFSGVVVTRYLVLCVCFVDVVCV